MHKPDRNKTLSKNSTINQVKIIYFFFYPLLKRIFLQIEQYFVWHPI